MKLTYKQAMNLKKGSIIYYKEYNPGQEKTTFDDILQVVGKTEYSGPEFKVLGSKVGNEFGETTAASLYEIENGRAYAISDKDFIIKLLFEKDLW